MACSPPGSSVHRTSYARTLELIVISFSRWSSQPRDQTHVTCIGRWILYHWATQEAQLLLNSWTHWRQWVRHPWELGPSTFYPLMAPGRKVEIMAQLLQPCLLFISTSWEAGGCQEAVTLSVAYSFQLPDLRSVFLNSTVPEASWIPLLQPFQYFIPCVRSFSTFVFCS